MMRQGARKFFRWISEALVTGLVVVLCYAILLSVLYALFPSGNRLQLLFSKESLNEPGGALEKAIRKLLLSRGQWEADLENSERVAARLSKIERDVNSKRSQAIAWRRAEVDMPLYDRDAVQTLKLSGAEIRFDARNTMEMGAESILIIKRLDDDPLTREKRTFLLLVNGDLHGRSSSGGEKSRFVEVQTPSATVRTDTRRPGASDSDFRIRVNPDRSSTVTVYQGRATVTAGGKTVMLADRQATRVPLGQAPLPALPLPDPVAVAEPLNSETFYYRKLPPRIRFAWAHQPGAKKFRFILARDPSFENVILEETVGEAFFSHGNLKNGTYYWRVSALGEYGEGMFSDARRLSVIQDLQPPQLRVDFPPKVVSHESCTLSGQTEPGARVYIDGKPIRITADGQFRQRVNLKPGANVILIESFDRVDNVAYLSQVVHRKL